MRRPSSMSGAACQFPGGHGFDRDESRCMLDSPAKSKGRGARMNVVVFASRKGGSGKSTLTAHLAAHAHRPSRRCMLIDCDPQGSISLWHKLRGTAEPQLRNGLQGVKQIV